MNNKTKMFSDWSEVTNGERNQIVFEDLNKSYGAFEIRTNYDRTLLKAFSAMGLLTILLSTVLICGHADRDSKIIIPRIDPILLYPPKTPETVFIPKAITTPPLSVRPKLMRALVPIITTQLKEDDNKNIIPIYPNIASSATGTPCDTCSDKPNNTFEEPTINTQPVEVIHELGDLDILPKFPGGDAELYRYLRNNVHIPEKITEMGSLKEKIGVVFIIDQDGTITDIALKQGSKYDELNNEAIRVVNKMPKWEPGKQNGNKVKVRMILPFRFEVKN